MAAGPWRRAAATPCRGAGARLRCAATVAVAGGGRHGAGTGLQHAHCKCRLRWCCGGRRACGRLAATCKPILAHSPAVELVFGMKCGYWLVMTPTDSRPPALTTNEAPTMKAAGSGVKGVASPSQYCPPSQYCYVSGGRADGRARHAGRDAGSGAGARGGAAGALLPAKGTRSAGQAAPTTIVPEEVLRMSRSIEDQTCTPEGDPAAAARHPWRRCTRRAGGAGASAGVVQAACAASACAGLCMPACLPAATVPGRFSPLLTCIASYTLCPMRL